LIFSGPHVSISIPQQNLVFY